MTATALATLERRDLRDLVPRDSTDDQQYLTFHMAGEHYGIDILKVQEIRGWTPVTVLPNMPAALLGVQNLRGGIVPVIDLRVQFGLESVACNKTTVVIVAWARSQDGGRTMGMAVDGVTDVLQVRLSEIQPAPDFGAAVDTTFVSGLVNTETGMTMLLDVDRLLGIGEGFDRVLPESGSAIPLSASGRLS